MSTPTYNRAIRKYVVGFGNLFNNITLVRYNPNQTEQERVLVPIIYATKELYVARLEGDPDLSKKIQVALPRMSFEMSGLEYDSARKLNTNSRTFAQTTQGVVSQYNPVPYNLDFNLYLYVRNIEDGTQIIEHILPFFTPDYTLKLNMVPELGIVKEVPVILNSATHDIVYEGDMNSETRMIIWTLNFTVKGYIFGKISDTGGVIKTSITNILSSISSTDNVVFNMNNGGQGTYKTGEIVYQGYSIGTATAQAKVISFVNNTLRLTDVTGNFVSSQEIVGLSTNAQWIFNSFNVLSTETANLATIIVTPNPLNAEANSAYTYNTTITEIANSGISIN